MAAFSIILLSIIGAIVIVRFGLALVIEIDRALRNGHRVATVLVRHSRRYPTFEQWIRCAWYEFMGTHSSLVIGMIEIPRNPRKPMRSRIRY